MSFRAVLLCTALLLLVSGGLRPQLAGAADDKPAPEKTGKLEPGADLPAPFHPFNVANGKYENKFHCLTNEHGLNPAVLIFAQNVDPASSGKLVDLLRELDKYTVEKPKTRLKAFAVFTYNDMPDVVKDDDVRDAHADELRKLKNAEPPLQQVVLALESPAALQKAGYDLDPKAQVVVVLYDKLKVTKIYTFDKPMAEGDVKAVMDEVKDKLAPYKK